LKDKLSIFNRPISAIRDASLVAQPPIGNNDSTPSEAMSYVNKYRDFAFQKISQIDYGYDDNIARYTGVPANQPDFIADFHFIALMRIIDDLLQHKYKGTIVGDYTNTGSA
jgi:hypothetical protein